MKQIFTLSGLYMMLLTGCSTSTTPGVAGRVTLQAPDSVAAGQPLRIQLSTQHVQLGEHLTLVWQGGWGTQVFEQTVTGTVLNVALPKHWTTRSGVQALRVWHRSKLVAAQTIHVRPQQPAQPLDLYLGAKSIIADGWHWSMITAIPSDSLGNPAPVETPVQFRFLRPNGHRNDLTSATHHLVAYQRITAQTNTGKTIVGVRAGNVSGKEKELLEVPGFPVNFKIEASNYTPLADQRQGFRILTNVLVDQHNNVVSDGTLVQFRCVDPDGSIRLIKGYTLRGGAEVALENPGYAGSMQVSASVYGAGRSNVLTLRFPENLKSVPVQIDQKRHRLRIGPLTESLDQLVPNGTMVTVQIDDRDPVSIEVVGGYAEADLMGIPPGPHSVELTVSGRTITLIIAIR
ncbi:hypothetical protein ACFSUS_27350 [Spirosoma soli]|uniref:Uncharacterized protein n=1 Tax=Spirosoma soli TaxID=1770529 RepID=A0ABW5MDB7_9BACT